VLQEDFIALLRELSIKDEFDSLNFLSDLVIQISLQGLLHTANK
jgi:hypothetical protein